MEGGVNFMGPMRKTIAILFVVIFTGATTELGQVLKLPLLVQHYLAHRETQPVSFWQFIYDHYSYDHQDADKNQDMQLPFKTVVTAAVITATAPRHRIEVSKPWQSTAEVSFPAHTNFIPQQSVCSIFHPPRTVS